MRPNSTDIFLFALVASTQPKILDIDLDTFLYGLKFLGVSVQYPDLQG